MSRSSEVQSQLKSIEALIRHIEKTTDPEMTATAKKLVQVLMELHGAALERILELISQTLPSSESIIESLGRDDLVRSLLLLYGLHPDDIETRVMQAIEKTRPYLNSHGGNVNLIEVDDSGVVKLRLEGNGHGCSPSSATLNLAIEDAIYDAAPDVTAINIQNLVQENSPANAFVPLSHLTSDGHESKIESNPKTQRSGI